MVVKTVVTCDRCGEEDEYNSADQHFYPHTLCKKCANGYRLVENSIDEYAHKKKQEFMQCQ